jgi:hypothetical protein
LKYKSQPLTALAFLFISLRNKSHRYDFITAWDIISPFAGALLPAFLWHGE